MAECKQSSVCCKFIGCAFFIKCYFKEMGGCCCCSSKTNLSGRQPLYNYNLEDEPLSSNHDTPSEVPELLVHANLAPSGPVPYQEYNALQQLVNLMDSHNTRSTENYDRKNEHSRPTGSFLLGTRPEDPNISDDLKGSVVMCNTPWSKETLSNLDSSIIPCSDEEDVCPTCLEEYDDENPRITAKCNHHFHLSCILEWLERSNTCAVCNKIMEVEDGSFVGWTS
ncbi:hypothetical protein HPP92_020362 [Vanilla planifolia]|uniref:RING-type E3 ubiquitin transferase n=1 Tax=Vanilla planifolia TaxID=51239 RepID=A0A835PWS1_VANPL|nr:hypothetical protein HPP92_020362 [Vanilla planifolia]